MKDTYGNRMEWDADPATYLHFIKPFCVVCEAPIKAEDYVVNGNYCLRCCAKANKVSHQRLWEKKKENFFQSLGVVDSPVAR